MPNVGEDEEHRGHPEASDHQGPTTAIMFDNVETIERGAEVDAVQDHLSDKRVVDTGSLRGGIMVSNFRASRLLKDIDSPGRW